MNQNVSVVEQHNRCPYHFIAHPDFRPFPLPLSRQPIPISYHPRPLNQLGLDSSRERRNRIRLRQEFLFPGLKVILRSRTHDGWVGAGAGRVLGV